MDYLLEIEASLGKAQQDVGRFKTLFRQMTLQSESLEREKADLVDLLRAAVARIELANAEGDDILSAWLPDAKATLLTS